MKQLYTKNLSTVVEQAIEGYHAAVRGEPFDEKQTSAWKEGYDAHKSGLVLRDDIRARFFNARH